MIPSTLDPVTHARQACPSRRMRTPSSRRPCARLALDGPGSRCEVGAPVSRAVLKLMTFAASRIRGEVWGFSGGQVCNGLRDGANSPSIGNGAGGESAR